MTAPLLSTTSFAGGSVRQAIASASARTGVDFGYLLGQAQIESGLNANAKAATSSATGLFQFVDQSWLQVLDKHGAEHGLGWAADAIGKSGGRYHVTDPALRAAVMDLRRNPEVASLMAAAHASDNRTAVESCLGREATGTDLYICHFLGQAGGTSFLSALANDGGRAAASLFPAAARTNRGVFYNKDGSTRSLNEVYARFADKLGNGQQLAGNPLPAGAADTATLNRLELARIQAVRGDSGESAGEATLGVNLLRPNPANARLAYLMLAGLGG